MALTKGNTVVANNTTLTASAADTTSANQDVSGSYQTIVHVQFTNGATGPTVAAQTRVQVSEDGTNYYDLTTLKGSTTNSDVVAYHIDIHPAVSNVRFISGSNTGQNVTLRIVIEKITAL